MFIRIQADLVLQTPYEAELQLLKMVHYRAVNTKIFQKQLQNVINVVPEGPIDSLVISWSNILQPQMALQSTQKLLNQSQMQSYVGLLEQFECDGILNSHPRMSTSHDLP